MWRKNTNISNAWRLALPHRKVSLDIPLSITQLCITCLSAHYNGYLIIGSYDCYKIKKGEGREEQGQLHFLNHKRSQEEKFCLNFVATTLFLYFRFSSRYWDSMTKQSFWSLFPWSPKFEQLLSTTFTNSKSLLLYVLLPGSYNYRIV